MDLKANNGTGPQGSKPVASAVLAQNLADQAVIDARMRAFRLPRGRRYKTPECVHCVDEELRHVGTIVSGAVAACKRQCETEGTTT